MRTIVWDIDDVLNNLMRCWFEQCWLPAHPSAAVRYEDLVENPPYRVLSMSAADYYASLDEFRGSPAAARMQPNPAVTEWLRENGSGFRHVALTARPLSSAPEAAEWLFRNFGGYFRCFGVVPSRPEAGIPIYDRHKGDYLQWLDKADVFVDDSEENVRFAGELGIHAVLYPQPWNQSRNSIQEALQQLAADMVIAH